MTITPTAHDQLHAILDGHEDAADDARAILLGEEAEPETEHYTTLAALLGQLSEPHVFALCLELSLCPLHRCDYAICFDEGDEECAHIRAEHPGHDT